MSLSQNLQQKLLQKLSPQQIQLMKLLQVPTAHLEERVKEELEENPALEAGEEGQADVFEETKENLENSDDDFEKEGTEDEYENIDISDYVSEGDDDVGDYKLRDDNYPDSDENKTIPQRIETSFYDLMLEQLNMLDIDAKRKKVAVQIVGSLDDDGYLRREVSAIVDDLAFRQGIDTDEQEVEGLILMIQQFDPPGVAARNLKECLLLQLRRKKEDKKNVDVAIKILEKYFEEFTKKHYEKIQRGMGLNDEEIKHVINLIIKLNPKPGGLVGDTNKMETYVIPDFFVSNHNGILELTLNSKNAPDLRIARGIGICLKIMTRGPRKTKGKRRLCCSLNRR